MTAPAVVPSAPRAPGLAANRGINCRSFARASVVIEPGGADDYDPEASIDHGHDRRHNQRARLAQDRRGTDDQGRAPAGDRTGGAGGDHQLLAQRQIAQPTGLIDTQYGQHLPGDAQGGQGQNPDGDELGPELGAKPRGIEIVLERDQPNSRNPKHGQRCADYQIRPLKKDQPIAPDRMSEPEKHGIVGKDHRARATDMAIKWIKVVTSRITKCAVR